jgi:hypothetical protein
MKPTTLAVALLAALATPALVRKMKDSGHYLLAGPDTDQLGQEFRYDTCHFNAAGGERHAALAPSFGPTRTFGSAA